MSTTTRLITADELLVMPHRDEHGNDCRLELIRGEVKRMSPTGRTHGKLCLKLGAAILDFVESNDLGEALGAETGFTVERNPDSVLGADIAFVSKERLKDAEDADKFFPFAPDLAVEVLSPSNRAGEINEKISLYFSAGARMVWVVNPKRRTVAVYSSPDEARILGERDTLEGGDVLPGFSYELSKLFSAVKR
ncbi:MAG TPA: Uma2 family endonuclease [Pyrinomonadaceae bacterium]|nr:Uma2 family endonuclease [Pyrinomonadaceae bacterium]